MAKTSVDTIHRLLDEAYDRERVQSLYRQQCYAFGDAWSKSAVSSFGASKIVECPDIVVRELKIGESRRILNAAYISMSRFMSSTLEPEFPQVDRWTGEVRKQFFKARADSGIDGQEWSEELAWAYLDGDTLGIGGVLIVLDTNPVTKYQRVALEHIPATQIISDRHYRNIGDARFMAFVKYLSVDDAERRFGTAIANKYSKALFNDKSDTTSPMHVVRVIEYWDKGIGKSDPTRCVLMDDLDGEIVEHEPNPYPFIPFAHYTNWNPPGSLHPIGRVVMQMATHEAINEIERSLREESKQTSVNLVDTSQIDEEELEAHKNGEGNGFLAYSGNAQLGPAFQRIPAPETSRTKLDYYEKLNNQFNTDSGQSEMDRGNQLSADRTLGEVQLVAERSSVQGVWNKSQLLKFYRRVVEKAMHIAAMFDRDPLDVDVFGANVSLNDPADPRSFIGEFCRERSRIVIGEDALSMQDQQSKRQQKISELQFMGQLPTVNRQWLDEQIAKALGFDPKEALINPDEMQAMQPMQQPAQSAQ